MFITAKVNQKILNEEITMSELDKILYLHLNNIDNVEYNEDKYNNEQVIKLGYGTIINSYNVKENKLYTISHIDNDKVLYTTVLLEEEY